MAKTTEDPGSAWASASLAAANALLLKLSKVGATVHVDGVAIRLCSEADYARFVGAIQAKILGADAEYGRVLREGP